MSLVSQQPPMIWCGLGEAVKRCPQCALEYNRISRGTDGLQTRRWRKPDSNHWYRVTRSRFRERLMSPPLDFPLTEKSALARRKRRAPLAGLVVRIQMGWTP